MTKTLEDRLFDMEARLVKLEVKMNLITYIAGAALAGVIYLIILHVG